MNILKKGHGMSGISYYRCNKELAIYMYCTNTPRPFYLNKFVKPKYWGGGGREQRYLFNVTQFMQFHPIHFYFKTSIS